jgi:hypothetical protein
MVKDIRHKFSFNAIDDDGETHALHVYGSMIDVSDFDNPNAEIEGLKQIQTDDGKHVNRLEQGRYQIVATGQTLRSTDPNAP